MKPARRLFFAHHPLPRRASDGIDMAFAQKSGGGASVKMRVLSVSKPSGSCDPAFGQSAVSLARAARRRWMAVSFVSVLRSFMSVSRSLMSVLRSFVSVLRSFYIRFAVIYVRFEVIYVRLKVIYVRFAVICVRFAVICVRNIARKGTLFYNCLTFRCENGERTSCDLQPCSC